MEDKAIIWESGARLAAFDVLSGEAVPAPLVLQFIEAVFRVGPIAVSLRHLRDPRRQVFVSGVDRLQRV